MVQFFTSENEYDREAQSCPCHYTVGILMFHCRAVCRLFPAFSIFSPPSPPSSTYPFNFLFLQMPSPHHHLLTEEKKRIPHELLSCKGIDARKACNLVQSFSVMACLTCHGVSNFGIWSLIWSVFELFWVKIVAQLQLFQLLVLSSSYLHGIAIPDLHRMNHKHFCGPRLSN